MVSDEAVQKLVDLLERIAEALERALPHPKEQAWGDKAQAIHVIADGDEDESAAETESDS